MKKIGIGLVVMMGVSVSAGVARAEYGMAGCGLGSLLFGKDNSTGMQILAATTNGTFGSQTFGITSGTSNCVSGGAVALMREQIAFAEVNFRDLKRNMASGGGEFLNTFATLLGCEESAIPSLTGMTQEKYESILPNSKTTPVEMLNNVKASIAASPLKNACSDERALARAEGRPADVETVQIAKR
jgi:Protein of unknown function (DUF3015)